MLRIKRHMPDAPLTPRPSLPIILIGPINAGKSTIAPLLASRLSVGRADLDKHCWDYYAAAGFEQSIADREYHAGGMDAAYAYTVQYYPAAVERILAVNPRHVIDFGAGHTVYRDAALFERVRQALAPIPNVVLLLPSPDPDESLRLLATRGAHPDPAFVASVNDWFIRDPSNAQLAAITVYTKDKTPEETCEEIVERLR
jgi:adenylate kinase family enzyme